MTVVYFFGKSFIIPCVMWPGLDWGHLVSKWRYVIGTGNTS